MSRLTLQNLNFFKTILALATWRIWLLPDIFCCLFLKRWGSANSTSLVLLALPQSKARGTAFSQPTINTHSLLPVSWSGCLSVKSWWGGGRISKWTGLVLRPESESQVEGLMAFFVCMDPWSAKHGPGLKSLPCLFLYSLGAKNGFYILNWGGGGEKGRTTISSLRKIIWNSNFSIEKKVLNFSKKTLEIYLLLSQRNLHNIFDFVPWPAKPKILAS